MKIFNNTKKPTYEQHDNEKDNYYQFSSTKFESRPELKENIRVDVCIVGGGFTGIASALYLAKQGYKVLILEAKKIGSGASGRNGGQLGGGLRKEQKVIEKLLGFEHAKELWNMGLEAVEEVKNNIEQFKIDCDLKNGVLTAGYYEQDSKYFLGEIEHMQKKYNYNKYLHLDKIEIREEINSEKYYSGMLNKGSYHLHPLKYLYGIANESLKLKVDIYENSPVLKIHQTENGARIVTKKGEVRADFAVVACNGYLDDLLGNIRNKFMPINNYILATEPLGKEKASTIIKNNYAVSDTRFIIDYYRFSNDWRLIFGGGETFTKNFLSDASSYVKKRMYKVFPYLKYHKIDFCWGGTLAITVNRFPNFGSTYNNKVIYAHGFSGHGVALTTLAGKLISEYISGEKDRFNLFASIPHLTIPGGDLLRRPIYSLGVAYYKLLDTIR
ncbi:MAG: Gamma-glutamylputrescine oxidoreductase [Alphaproteobacteria bacterium MarineAlpha5_Bin11]|nr:FAD-dependent oxidoreductase [Pelagibacteraceae bacterium]PPR43766.1 MAG: Gamma-glutamylputrescine oxidoreductase [Alphaproteobacteria bacterium MarineAlpha5_Bin11]PPR51333.1 MAG: Gamma-glutamylputrescine oxidoreductase [Alphaproteobacteria bacterium MarineAlpha5_Bin10]|tara:strand:+ start:13755 stop:15080 length:1326 start_codon:yes stop_codon:yes gene_type:complete